MRWLIPRVLAIWLVLIFATSAALFIGRQQPPPLYLALLHLTDCEFPCWIGIVPGKTTVEEAQKRIIAVYGTDLTRYEVHKAFTVVDELSLPIDQTSPDFDIRIEQEINGETHFVNVTVIRDQNGIISSILIDFLNGDHTFAQLQTFIGTPFLVQRLPGSQVYSLFYKGATAEGYVDWRNECEAHPLSLELSLTKPAARPSAVMARWKGWRNLVQIMECL